MKKLAAILLVIAALAFSIFENKTANINEFAAVASYIQTHHELPENYITKREAIKLGWDARKGNLWEVAPNKSIGGDRFSNREEGLPKKPGRVWFEADIGYNGGHRGAKRILFSNDGLISKTEDHYKTFQKIK